MNGQPPPLLDVLLDLVLSISPLPSTNTEDGTDRGGILKAKGAQGQCTL